MRELLNYLPVLACPVGMGAMMWFMMRPGRKPAGTTAPADPREQELAALRTQVDDLREQMGIQPETTAVEPTR
ncbi:hypothetical protein ACJ6WF_47640 [Streptomyces sp. MMS24-I2-30]|uniref:hypothetical protein n=1 Tax=Streptomyces sp. MMS24-I2-30 TaxID=3351564 RepID=UPI0038969A5B